jgi:hypothetical protein
VNFVWYSLGIVCIKTMRAILWQKVSFSYSKWEEVYFANSNLGYFACIEISFIVEIALIKLNLRQITLETTSFCHP